MTAMAFEDDYLDVLQDIEAAIVAVYRKRRNLLDYDVDEALDALIADYKAAKQNRPPRPHRLTKRPESVYEAVKTLCDWRSGQKDLLTDSDLPLGQGPTPNTHEEIIACLKRVKKSVQRWNKHGGRQGYLNFVQEYLP